MPGYTSQRQAATAKVWLWGYVNVPRWWSVDVCFASLFDYFLPGYARLGVVARRPLIVAISPTDVAIGTGQTVQFIAIVTNDSSAVTWSATAGTIDANGNYTAPSGSPSTTVTVTATLAKNHSKTATATVNVVAPGEVTATAKQWGR